VLQEARAEQSDPGDSGEQEAGEREAGGEPAASGTSPAVSPRARMVQRRNEIGSVAAHVPWRPWVLQC
jgi:hypothetical protein